MTTAAFVLALIGVVLSAASIGWQIAIHFLSAPRFRVTVKAGLASGAGTITWDPGRRPQDGALQRHIRDGYTRPVVYVQVSNVGRSPGSVSAIKFDQGDAVYRPLGDVQAGPQLPSRVEPHDSQEWLVAAQGLLAAMESAHDVFGSSTRVITVIETGTGRSVRSRVALSSDDIVRV